VNGKITKTRPTARPEKTAAAKSAEPKESWIEQTASFVGFFIYLLILKSFFLPLFIIPTGSMAQTLYGQHAIHTCPNCGTEYPIGWQEPGNWTGPVAYHPRVVQCPNCRFRQFYDFGRPWELTRQGLDRAEILSQRLQPSSGDRIFVHGWSYDRPFSDLDGLGPARWDVVVFKVPTDGQTNYIKRLIGLPNEKIELIDGDVFVNDQIAAKTPDAQRALWFPYYNHDYPPREPSRLTRYFPRWVALDATSPWTDLTTRVVRFDGPQSGRAEIQFATDPGAPTEPGWVQDVYSYNEPRPEPDLRPNAVTDIQLSAEIELTAAEGGYVELSTTKGEHRFHARLGGDGSVTVLHQNSPDSKPETWGTTAPRPHAGPLRIALSHVDGTVRVELDGQVAFESTRAQYEITPATARLLATTEARPTIRIAAEKVQATLRHLLIERDVFYTSDLHGGAGESLPYGVQGNPKQLGPHDYFVLGDNSPNSQDARYAFARPGQDPVGPHLKDALARGEFHPGTVPADQMIGRAFFVYWPGCAPLTSAGPNLLPDLGRARWIR
jgi:signal peptidase I